MEEAQRAVDVVRATIADNAALSLDAHDALAIALGRTGRVEEAIDLKRRVLAGREKSFGRDSSRTIRCRKELAFLLNQAKRFEEAEPIAREAFDDAERALGPDAVETGQALFVLAQVVYIARRYEEAEGLFAEAARRALVAEPRAAWKAASIDVYRAWALGRLKRFDEAEAILIAALPLLRGAQGEDGRATRRALDGLAEVYDAQGKPEKAKEMRDRLEEAKATSRPAR